MNRRILYVVAAVAAIVINSSTKLASAQTNMPQVAQRWQTAIARLHLTDTQKSQVDTIRTQTVSQLESILKPEQQQVLVQALSSGQTPQQAVAALNLTATQRNQVRSTLRSSRQQLANILTQQMMQQLIQEFRNR